MHYKYMTGGTSDNVGLGGRGNVPDARGVAAEAERRCHAAFWNRLNVYIDKHKIYIYCIITCAYMCIYMYVYIYVYIYM